MNVAILIGISSYVSQPQLPGCKLDVSNMESLLRSTKKYQSILCIDEETDSTVVKEKITTFIENKSEEEVDEFFFYFSGHGLYNENEFYYILSDFDFKRKKQTALENTELDNLIKLLNPKLTIKVVDACQAGVAYVKDIDQVNDYIKSTQGNFDKCYFMFSSEADQKSYQQRGGLSFFTKSFLNSVVSVKAREIRYKDIIDFISDEFSSDSRQTPLFVTQASFVEKFCVITSDVLASLSFLKGGAGYGIVRGLETKNEKTLEELVREDAQNYCSKEEAMNILDNIAQLVAEYSFNLEGLYSTNVYHSELDRVPKVEDIGNWLKDNKHDYFAKAIIVEEPFFKGDDRESVGLFKLTIKRATGFEITFPASYYSIAIDSQPKYPNISAHQCMIVPIISKTSIRFFYFYTNYIEIGWDSRRLNNVSWKTVDCKIKDEAMVENNIEGILSGFITYIISPIQEKFLGSSAQEELEEEPTEELDEELDEEPHEEPHEEL